MKKRMFYTIFILLFILCPTFVVFASMTSQSYKIPTSVLSSGGNVMSSTSFQLESTLGQPSPLMDPDDTPISENYRLFPGFWYTIDITDNGDCFISIL